MSDSHQEFLKQQSIRLQASEALEDIHKVMMNLTPISFDLNRQAKKFFNYGILKRLITIEENYRWIYYNLRIEREDALSTDDTHRAGTYLNSIYLHIQGVIDNYAWLFLHQFQLTFVQNIEPTKVHLLHEKVTTIWPEGRHKESLLNLKDWLKEVKLKRHPIAHRLPLSVIPQILTKEEEQAYIQLNEQYTANINDYAKATVLRIKQKEQPTSWEEISQDNEQAKVRRDEFETKQKRIESDIQQLGRFWPVFTYPESEEVYALYPTVPTDIQNMCKICSNCNAIIKDLKPIR